MSDLTLEELRAQFYGAIKRQQFQAQRTISTRGRNLEGGVMLTQLSIRRQRQLRILAPGNGASAEDVGKFWFTVGYSRVGGPDVIPID